MFEDQPVIQVDDASDRQLDSHTSHGETDEIPLNGSPARRQRKKSDRPIPTGTFRDSLEFAAAVDKFGSGEPVFRISLLNELGKGINSSATRELISAAVKYGLISGNYNSEKLAPTPALRTIVGGTDATERARTKIEQAVGVVEPFKLLLEPYTGKAMPSQQALRDFLRSKGIADEWLTEVVDTFIDNAKFVGLLKVKSGSEMLLTIDNAIAEIVNENPRAVSDSPLPPAITTPIGTVATQSTDLSQICFYITPIGSPDSAERAHSDLFLHHIVAPALKESGLTVIRADKIGESGMITSQVIQHIVQARLVIADLSFHNPNVFYELAIRHACRLPTVQIIRSRDSIPFDLGQLRTIQIDDSSIYSLIPQLETYQSEIATQVRKALSEGAEAINPISAFFPGLRVATAVQR